MRSSAITLAALVASASAIRFTWPNQTDSLTPNSGLISIDLSVPQTITWAIDSDQESSKTITKIALVVPPANGATDPNTPVSSTTIASNVKASDLKYVLQPPSGLTVNGTYQVWFYQDFNATANGIWAETQFFQAGKIAATSTNPTNTGGSAPTATGSTTTISPTKKPNAGSALKAFGSAGLLTAMAMLLL